MKEKETLQNAADALLQEAVTITVDVFAANRIDRLLQACRLKPRQRTFHIRPLVLGSLVRISKRLLDIDTSAITKELLDKRIEFFQTNFEMMTAHSRAIAEIAAIAVTNTKEAPPNRLVEFFLYQLKPAELMRLFTIVVSQMDLAAFTSSIISIRGLGLLETNPKTQGSQIASGTSSAE